MDKQKLKKLIVVGNVIAVIAIISIILLYNYNTQSVTVQDEDSEVDKIEESETDSPDEMSRPPLNLVENDYEEAHESKDEIEEKKEKEENEENETGDKGDETETSEDSDGDGLTDEEEAEIATDARNVDTDSDGLNDGEEVERGTDPNHNDTDRDGIRDGDEVANGTNPLKDESAASSSDSSSSSSSSNNEKQSKPEKDDNKEKVEKPNCGKNQELKNGKCVDKEPLTYVEKVQNRLPGYKVTDGNQIVIRNKNGKIAKIKNNKQIIILTENTDLGHTIVSRLGGLVTP